MNLTSGNVIRTTVTNTIEPVTGQASVTITNLPAQSNSAVPTASAGLVAQPDGSWTRTVTLSKGNSWSDLLTRLEKEDDQHHEYVYYIASVSETGIPDGTTVAFGTTNGAEKFVYGNSSGSHTLTVTDTLPKTSISAEKVWNDDNDAARLRPTEIQFTLSIDGVPQTDDVKTVSSTENWTATWNNLELYKADGTLHTYSVAESDVTNYTLDSETFANGKFTFTNRPSTGKVRVEKVFGGINALPKAFKITNSYNSTEFTVATASGAGTEQNPYYWEISGVPLGTTVTFTESGYQDQSGAYSVVTYAQSSTASEYTRGDVAATATSAATGTTAKLKNIYTQNPGSLRLAKAVQVGGADVTDDNKALTDGTYTFAVKNASDVTVCTVKIVMENGAMHTATIDNVVTSITGGYVEVTGLTPGAYTITETESTNGAMSLDTVPKSVTVRPGETGTAAVLTTITNNLETTSVTVTKKWNGNTWPEKVSAVVVTLKAGGNDASVTESDNGHGAAVTLTKPASGNEATATWSNLPVKYANGTAITYTVEETSVTYDRTTYTASTTPRLTDMFEITTSPASVTDGQAEITNRLYETNLSVLKIDQTTRGAGTPTPISGAQFTLIKADANGQYTVTVGTETSGQDGMLSFGNLTAGTYRLEETYIPAGYSRTGTGRYIYFTVAGGAVTRQDGAEYPDAILNSDATVTYASNQYTVGNTPGARLPATGGMGTELIYATGVGLLLLAVIGWVLREKRRAWRG